LHNSPSNFFGKIYNNSHQPSEFIVVSKIPENQQANSRRLPSEDGKEGSSSAKTEEMAKEAFPKLNKPASPIPVCKTFYTPSERVEIERRLMKLNLPSFKRSVNY